jgi:iron uptake system EfeUOB component EfeO/EfeM
MAFALSNWTGKATGATLVVLAGLASPILSEAASSPGGRPALAAAGDVEPNPTPPPLDEDRSAEIDRAAAAFKPLAMADVDSTVAGVERLVQAVEAGDRAAAQRAWIEARIGWERSEIFTATMVPDLDKAIDSWPDAHSGFHTVEFLLFATSRMPVAESRELLDNLKIFQHVIQQQAFTGRILMVGVATLAYEVGEGKSKGGESEVSGTSLADIQHNVEAIDRAWHAIFAPSIATKDKKLAKRIEGEIAALKKLVFVPSLLDIDPPTLEQTAESLAGSIAEADFKLGWYPIDFTDGD